MIHSSFLYQYYSYLHQSIFRESRPFPVISFLFFFLTIFFLQNFCVNSRIFIFNQFPHFRGRMVLFLNEILIFLITQNTGVHFQVSWTGLIFFYSNSEQRRFSRGGQGGNSAPPPLFQIPQKCPFLHRKSAPFIL